MNVFRHILVPVDFDPPSLHALDVALDLARKFDARLTILHAWDIVAYEYAETVYVAGDFLADLESAAKLQLDDAVSRACKLLPRTEGLLVRGNASLVVMDTIKKVDADLVVMGTHNREGIVRILLGSVAEKVVRGSPVPVLTVRGTQVVAQSKLDKGDLPAAPSATRPRAEVR